jgi:hypothetical protein
MNTKLMAAVALLLLAGPFSWAQSPYWTGDGGKGKSITILPPRGVGLAANQAYLPDFVANELLSNFSTFSAMTPFDRVNNQRQYDELLSGYYADDDKAALDLGHLASTDYMLLGTITKTSTGYALQLTINSNRDKTTAAAYSAAVSVADLDNLSGVRKASLDLLQKMGVQLTARARTELTSAATAGRVSAQTAMAQGITAQRQGNTVETMARFYEAASYDPSLAEAVARANTLSATVRTGNVGEDLRNDLAWRNEWSKILRDARSYLLQPFDAAIVEIGQLKQGKPDYQSYTVEFSFDISVKGKPYPPAFQRMVKDLNDGLKATKRNNDWKLTPLNLAEDNRNKTIVVNISADLINGRKVLNHADIYVWLDYGRNGTSPSSDILRGHVDHNGKTIYPVVRGGVSRYTQYFTVGANDITDQMTIQVLTSQEFPSR